MSVATRIKSLARTVLVNIPAEHVHVSVGRIAPGGLLAGKRIVITGGGKGIGYAIAEACIEQGADVVISGRHELTLEKATRSLGEHSHAVVFDVRDVESDVAFLTSCEELLNGPIDCLVSNAGVSCHEKDAFSVEPESFDLQVETNMRGAYFLCNSFLEEIELGGGSSNAVLLLIGSETSDIAYDIPYGMTKAAMDSYMRAMARRCYKSGIRLNAIAPGVVLTDLTKELIGKRKNDITYDVAAGRLIMPEEIAEVALFLMCDASKCISGEVIHCNAGNHQKVRGDTYH